MIHRDELARLQSPAETQARSVVLPLSEKRRSRRCRIEWDVVLHWLDESAVLCKCAGVLRDISAGGVGLETKQMIQAGQPVMVRIASTALNGAVRHVQSRSDGCLIGIEILPSSSNHLEALRRLNSSLDSLAEPNLDRPSLDL